MDKHSSVKRPLAYLLSLLMIIATVPPVGAMDSVYGTVKAAGPVWVAGAASEAGGDAGWTELSTTRPLLSGDRLRTGEKGYALAELGDQGVVGLYGNARVVTDRSGDAAFIDVAEGKVAFHIGEGSAMILGAQGARIGAEQAADGYIEVSSEGEATVTAEQGKLLVTMAGSRRELAAGHRLSIASGQIEPLRLAGAYGEAEESDETPVAPPPPPPPPAEPELVAEPAPAPAPAPALAAPAAQLSASAVVGWTALALVTAAVIYQVADDDDDNPASPY